MRSFIQNIVSYFEKITGNHYLTTTDGSSGSIVSGYSYPLKKYQHKLSPENCDRQQVGILYADIVEYSRLSEQDEESTRHRLLDNMKIMKEYVLANSGLVVHFTDDAILAEFEDADNALNCAINMQLTNRQWNFGLRSDRKILFRIGVNFGDEVADRGDIFGNDMNLAARLEKLAHTGGICVSESVRRRLKNHPSFKFIAMGMQYLKNIDEPARVFWIESGADRTEQVDHASLAISSYRDCYY